MIQVGNTIVYRQEDGSKGFYWLCIVNPNDYVFFSWFGNPHRPVPSDYWKVSDSWFKSQVEKGTIEIFESLPLEKYGDEFNRQAEERNK